MDLFWQWLTSMCGVGVQQLSQILVSNLDQIKLVSYLACMQAVVLTSIPGKIFAWYLVMFGSRYVGDKRYEQFWGLCRAMLIGVVIASVLAIPMIPRQIKNGVTINANDEDEAAVKNYVETIAVGASTLGSILLGNFMSFLSNCFTAWTQFKLQSLCYCVGALCTIPFFVVAYVTDDFALMMSGMTVYNFAVLIALLLVWYWKVLPNALDPAARYDEDTSAEAELLLEKEKQLLELETEIKALHGKRESKFRTLSETMGWSSFGRRQTHTEGLTQRVTVQKFGNVEFLHDPTLPQETAESRDLDNRIL